MPKTWGNWVNTEALAKEGGQGRVFFVRNTERAEEPVRALKELKNPKRHDRFQKEIDAMLALGSHPRVVEIIDHGIFIESKNRSYYVMEIADSSLSEKMESLKGNYDLIFETFRAICAGVSYIHSKGILHRDLKPENLLFFGDEVKVADLGLCLVVDEDHRLTAQSEAVGPRFYMAPELEDGRQLNVDVRCDVYSLGKVLYFLLSGGSIFAREKFDDSEFNLSKLLDDERFKLFQPIFRKALSIQPVFRYQSVAELARAVDDAVAKFKGHPRSSLFAKFADPAVSFLGDPQSVTATCDAQEVAQLLRLLQKTVLNGVHLASLAGNLDASSVDSFLELLEKNAHHLTEELLVAVVAEVLSNGKLCPSVMRSSFGESRWYRFVEIGLKGESTAVLNNVANEGLFFFRHNPGLIGTIASRIELLSPEARNNFVMECIFCNFDGKGELFRGELARDGLSSDDRERAIAGLAASPDQGSFKALCDTANDVTTIEEVGEILRGVVLTPVGAAKGPLLAERLRNPDEDLDRMLKIGLGIATAAYEDPASDEANGTEA